MIVVGVMLGISLAAVLARLALLSRRMEREHRTTRAEASMHAFSLAAQLAQDRADLLSYVATPLARRRRTRQLRAKARRRQERAGRGVAA